MTTQILFSSFQLMWSFDLKTWKWCKNNSKNNVTILFFSQEANFANNRIEITQGLNHPMLERLNLNCKFSQIESFIIIFQFPLVNVEILGKILLLTVSLICNWVLYSPKPFEAQICWFRVSVALDVWRVKSNMYVAARNLYASSLFRF